MNSQQSEVMSQGLELGRGDTGKSQTDTHLNTKLERRRRIEELFEERRLREELEDFEF